MNAHSPTLRTNRFDVFKYVNGVRQFQGVVIADNQTLADRKAVTLFGSGVWTSPKEMSPQAIQRR